MGGFCKRVGDCFDDISKRADISAHFEVTTQWLRCSKQRIRRRGIDRNDVVPRAHELKNSQKYGIISIRFSDAQIEIAQRKERIKHGSVPSVVVCININNDRQRNLVGQAPANHNRRAG